MDKYLGIILIICIAAICQATEENCIVVKNGEKNPEIENGGVTCRHVVGDDNRYCLVWKCPTLDCSDPVATKKGCPFCEGTCVIGGQIHKEGESFQCPDGCNRCSCYREGDSHVVMSTAMGCFSAEPPKECVKKLIEKI